MKRTICTALMVALVGCSAKSDEAESLGEASEALNGELSDEGFLKRKTIAPDDENLRRDDTDAYYDRVGTDRFGGESPSIRSSIGRLEDFRTRYEFDIAGEITASYYNRGDLGLGRDMHCRTTSLSETACYVTNFASGEDGSEFTFGLSPEIAFANMAAGNDVATVAMVYRPLAATDAVIFAVYNGAGDLTNTAPLDRHGLNFFNAFEANDSVELAKAGTPGTQFNNHIPSNCLNCHGGSYRPNTPPPGPPPEVTSAYFLPFDLDQFEYQNAPGKTRNELQDEFRGLNQLVRGVAAQGGIVNHPIYKQIQGWYGATGAGGLTGDFNSNFVPGNESPQVEGWDDTAEDIAVYRKVVRPSCRGCHLASSLPFESASSFPAGLASSLLASHSMPHALQTQREFWQSGQPVALENWFISKGFTGPGSAAAILHNAGPGNIVTLDPHLITASTE